MSTFDSTIEALRSVDEERIASLLHLLIRAQIEGMTVFLAGNGGSFATALHWGLDLQKVAHIRTHVLGSNGGLLTAFANDESYEGALSAELSRLAKHGDAIIALSCSGTSPNIVELTRMSRLLYVKSVLVTSSHHPVDEWADHIIPIDSTDYGVIENCHVAIGHWLVKELQK